MIQFLIKVSKNFNFIKIHLNASQEKNIYKSEISDYSIYNYCVAQK